MAFIEKTLPRGIKTHTESNEKIKWDKQSLKKIKYNQMVDKLMN